jgi:hypothetical protein
MAPPAVGLKVLNTKRYIIATLLATMAMAVVITVSFVMLSPARVHFSVTNAGSRRTTGGGVEINLTLAANNTSRRAAVVYETMFIYMDSSSYQSKLWAEATPTLTTGMPLLQPPGNATTLKASLHVAGLKSKAADFTPNMTGNFTVTVTATAWFKVGIARTRLYNIEVSCSPVDIYNRFNYTLFPVDCAA